MASLKITKENFDNEVMKTDLPVLIDFWAPWCGPCRMLGPVIEEVADELAGSVKVCKINVDEEPALAEKFRVMSIPTMIIVKGGKITNTSVGFRPKEQIKALIEK